MSPDDMNDERLSRIYREAAREEPAMRLDSAILSKAREAVERRNWWKRIGWVTPLATTAVAMLTVSLVIQMKQHYPETMAPASVEETAPALTVPKVPTAPKGAQEQKELMKDELRQAEPAKVLKMKPAAPAPAMDMAPAENEMNALPSRTATGAAKQMDAAERSQFRERDAEAGVAAPMADMPAEVQAIPETEATLPPEPWIAKIREFIKQGKKDAALKELEAFKAAYPDYQLPADLN